MKEFHELLTEARKAMNVAGVSLANRVVKMSMLTREHLDHSLMQNMHLDRYLGFDIWYDENIPDGELKFYHNGEHFYTRIQNQ